LKQPFDLSSSHQALICVSDITRRFAESVPVFVATVQLQSDEDGTGTQATSKQPKEASKEEQMPLEFLQAKQRELDSFKSNGVFKRISISEANQLGAQIIRSRWVCNWKEIAENTRIPKARLVAKGYEEQIDSEEAIDAPTSTREGLHCSPEELEYRNHRHQDSFSSSDADKPLAIFPPDEASEDGDTVWLLVKSMYGLRSAPKDWRLAFIQGCSCF
jgi:hypothetical protein